MRTPDKQWNLPRTVTSAKKIVGSASDAALKNVALPSDSVPDFFSFVCVLCANSHSSLMLRLCVCPSDKLDGLRTGTKRKRDWEAIASRMEDYLQLPDDYDTRASEPGKKRVRDFVNNCH